MVKRYMLGKDVAILKAPHEIRRKNIDKFIQQYIHQYKRRIFTGKIAFEFDAVVVGSDQVWRPVYSQPIEEAFLSFLGDASIKRIAYAASFGLDNCSEYSREQLETCSCLLKKFNAVSVRESSGVELCRNYFGVNAVQMLDPTLLLSVDDYRMLIDKVNTKSPQDNMLVYILDKTEEKIDLVNRIASEKGLIPFWLDSPNEQNENLSLDKQVKMSVEQWLCTFNNASFVVTDSFHGCVFSILFHKQFVAVGNVESSLSLTPFNVVGTVNDGTDIPTVYLDAHSIELLVPNMWKVKNATVHWHSEAGITMRQMYSSLHDILEDTIGGNLDIIGKSDIGDT